MHGTWALAVVMAGLSSGVKAQDDELRHRLTLFQNAQNTCKARVLLDSKLAADFVIATKSSLSDVCECAAMLTVANTSNQELQAIAGGERRIADHLATEVIKNFGRCLQLQ